jgi:tight adherence protein B
MKIPIVLFFIFSIVSLIMYLTLTVYSQKRRIKTRLEEFLPSPEIEEATIQQENTPSFIKRFFFSIANVFKSVQFSENTEKIIIESGSNMKPEEFFALRILTTIGLGILSAFIDLPWYLTIIAVIIGFVIPKYFMKSKRKKRLALVNYQLIEVLGMMANSMRAGFSFMQAMQLVGKEVTEPLGPEFDRVVRQAGLGVPLDVVFEECTERLPNKELEVVVRAILAQRRSGGNLAELLEIMEETIRGRVRILEELNTLTAQGRMSTWVITLIPVGLGFYLALLNKEYFAPMLEHPLGWMLIVIATISTFTGWVLIRKIIHIEV